MKTLIIPKTEDTPEVRLNPADNIFKISHRSLPENAIEFYMPVFNWFEDYLKKPNSQTHFDFELEYFNTSTAKQIAKLLIFFERLKDKSEVVIRWHYDKDDPDMLASGARYAKLINVDFEFIPH